MLRPRTDQNRQPSTGTTLPPLEMPGGISTPPRPTVTSPTIPPITRPSAGMPLDLSQDNTSAQAQIRTDAGSTNEARLLYDEFVAAAEEQISGIGQPTVIQGRYFYPSAPLGLEYAGQTMRVPLGINSQTGQYEFDEFFELDPSRLRVDRRMQREAARFGQYMPGVTAVSAGAPVYDEEGAARLLNSLSLNELNAVKSALVQIGAFDFEEMGAVNYFDTQSNPRIQQGFNRLIALAQNNSMDWRTLLSQMIQNGDTLAPVDGDTRGGGGFAPAFRLSSKEDLRAIADNVATRTIGRALSEEEANAFVASYQDMERAFQQRLRMGGEVEQPASPDVAAAGQIREMVGDEYDVYQMGNTLDMFQRALAGQP